MFCTECHIAFSWRSGEIETGAIHNPHYFQIQREMAEKLTKEARNALENNVNRNLCGPCGDDNMPNMYLYQGILRELLTKHILSQTQYNWLWLLYRQVTHLNGAIMGPMRAECRRLRHQYNLRARYILSIISKENFEIELVENDAIYNRNIASLQIYDLFITIFRECINKIAEERSADAIAEAYAHINQISSYANVELARLSYIYGKSIDLFVLKSCIFDNTRFTKTTYLAIKNSKLTHTSIDFPLRRMVNISKATLKMSRRYNVQTRLYETKCPSCKNKFEIPYYTSVWSGRRNKSICLKCLFNQPNKTPKLIKSLEKEEAELIKYYTSKDKDKEKLQYVKCSIKDWNDTKGGGAPK